MIPHRLRLHNFMCYGEDVPPLSFDSFHLACLSGDNGHGKSALLDAITWCLWGRARSRSDDELVHFGRTDMEVEFEFDMGDNRYRVLRKRSLRHGTRRTYGVSSLEFQVYDEGSFRSLTGDSIADTQRLIVEVLHMDYDTFTNSALILQGRADEFTVKPPAERKRVLADILGLRQYDCWEERARELARAAEVQRRELQSAINDIDLELQRLPQHEEEHRRALEIIADLEAEIKRLDVEVSRLRAQQREMAFKQTRAHELAERVRGAECELAEIAAQQAKHRRRIAELEATLAERLHIQTGYEQLLRLRKRNDELSVSAARFAEHGERRSRLEASIAEVRQALVAEIRGHEAAAVTLRQCCEKIPLWQKDKLETEQCLENMSRLETELGARREALQDTRQEMEALRSSNERLRGDMELLKEKLDLLREGSTGCPLCESALSDSDRERLRQQFLQRGRELGDEYRANAARLRDLERLSELAQRELAEMESTLRERVVLQRRHAVLEKSLADAAEFADQAAERESKAAELRVRLELGDYALREQAALAQLAAEMQRLGYVPAEHQRVRSELEALACFDGLKAQLDLAEARLGEEKAALEREERACARWQARMAEDRDALRMLQSELQNLAELERRLAAAERDLDRRLAQQSEAGQRLGRAQQMLNHCRYLERQRQEKLAIQKQAAQDKSVYEDLALAFGKKGIQAMLIESAIPEIEREANALLSRMTDNGLHVSFETQRDAKTVDGVIETLDIRVADELGARSYETYSGGEAFRINFAIRIALSKLLAHRVGARLQTLIVDEGFGSQDAQGRERLVEAINSISHDFEKILVITHIQELKDAFPVRIEVVKGPEGSYMTVS